LADKALAYEGFNGNKQPNVFWQGKITLFKNLPTVFTHVPNFFYLRIIILTYVDY